MSENMENVGAEIRGENENKNDNHFKICTQEVAKEFRRCVAHIIRKKKKGEISFLKNYYKNVNKDLIHIFNAIEEQKEFTFGSLKERILNSNDIPKLTKVALEGYLNSCCVTTRISTAVYEEKKRNIQEKIGKKNVIKEAINIANKIKEGKDITKEEALKLVRDDLETYDLTEYDLTETHSEEAYEYILEDVLYKGEPTVLASAPGVGKSTIASTMAVHIAAGKSFFGKKVKKKKVLCVFAEESIERSIIHKINAYQDSQNIKVEKGYLTLIPQEIKQKWLTIDKVGSVDLKAIILASGAEVIFIDPINALLGSVDTNKGKDIREVLGDFTQWCRDNNIAQLYIHHNKKAQKFNSYDDMMAGSYEYKAIPRHVCTVQKRKNEENKVYLSVLKSNIIMDARESIKFHAETTNIKGHEYAYISNAEIINIDGFEIFEENKKYKPLNANDTLAKKTEAKIDIIKHLLSTHGSAFEWETFSSDISNSLKDKYCSGTFNTAKRELKKEDFLAYDKKISKKGSRFTVTRLVSIPDEYLDVIKNDEDFKEPLEAFLNKDKEEEEVEVNNSFLNNIV